MTSTPTQRDFVAAVDAAFAAALRAREIAIDAAAAADAAFTAAEEAVTAADAVLSALRAARSETTEPQP